VDAFFRQQLMAYADHHRDPRNCAAHYLGIPMLFLAVIMPFALWRTEIAGLTLTAAPFMTAIGIAGWIVIDRFVGIAMIVAVTPFVALAQWIALRFGAATVWAVSASLLAIGTTCLVVGHAAFERRRPALADNLFQAFIGPMFIVSKALVALGFRADLADSLNGSGDFGAARSAQLSGHSRSHRSDRG
jgi:uncharacterized membrane protein YGL010W